MTKLARAAGAIASWVLTCSIVPASTPVRLKGGAPSVHLWYPLPAGVNAAVFYAEVTPRSDPLWSYYEVCGFSRGYFGIQVNSATERRIIFSVWDAGHEPTDPGKVPPEDRVQLVARGEGVVVSTFGNEGTGGHSHLVYRWKTGHTCRLAVTARPNGDSTIYSGYFYFPERRAWGLIASFRAPRDGGYLRGLYSFDEDFNSENGDRRRLAWFGNQWVAAPDGRWIELTQARFTHTADGYLDRLDRGARVVHNRFELSTGGGVSYPTRYGDVLDRRPTGRRPSVSRGLLARQP